MIPELLNAPVSSAALLDTNEPFMLYIVPLFRTAPTEPVE